MGAETEYLEEIAEIDVGAIGGKRQADIVLDSAPGQQAGLLKDNPEASGTGGAELAAEIRIQSCGDLQDRRLAATGRANQRTERPGLEPKLQVTNDFHPRTICRQKALRSDAKLKRGGVSSGLRVVQAVAPQGFRSEA